MSQRRSNVVAFVKSPPSKPVMPGSKLRSVTCVTARASWPASPPFVRKAARLHAAAPDVAAIVETLLDDLLTEVS